MPQLEQGTLARFQLLKSDGGVSATTTNFTAILLQETLVITYTHASYCKSEYAVLDILGGVLGTYHDGYNRRGGCRTP